MLLAKRVYYLSSSISKKDVNRPRQMQAIENSSMVESNGLTYNTFHSEIYSIMGTKTLQQKNIFGFFFALFHLQIHIANCKEG